MYNYSSYYNTANNIAIGSIIIYIIVAIVVQILFGVATKHINESKGYTGGFAWGFWLGIIGIIVVACKADNRSTVTYEAPRYAGQSQSSSYSSYLSSSSSASRSVSNNTWKCPCGQENSENLNYCTRCRRTKNEAQIELAQSTKIACPHCGAMNKPTNEQCFACGKPMKEEEVPTQIETKEIKQDQPNASAIEMLKQLAQLHEQGILTDQEFESKKSEVLAKI